MPVGTLPGDGRASGPNRVEALDFTHTGPGALAGRYLRTFWQPVFVAADLPAGRSVPIRIMDEQLTLYRGETGTAHLVAFRCAHRGTQLSTGWVEGDDLRCFYHGWKYDATGQCIEQPAEPEPFCGRISIRAFPTEEYIGLIFAYLGEGQPPLLPRYPEFEDSDSALEAGRADWPCNFFQRNENTPDLTHVAFVHRQSSPAIPRMESATETDFGIAVSVSYPDGSASTARLQMPNKSQFRLPPRSADEVRGRDNVFWRVPVDDDNHVSFSATVMHLTPEAARQAADKPRIANGADHLQRIRELGDSVLAGAAHISDVMQGPYDRVTIMEVQDYVSMVGQGNNVDRGLDHPGRADLGIVLLRKVWERELQALADGRPLTQWDRTPLPGP
ncbi:MAG: hypothetical protein HW416_190 [Chloroflexi bacterium]|nr:hypothetical protein [Chloroflexota bacterium]